MSAFRRFLPVVVVLSLVSAAWAGGSLDEARERHRAGDDAAAIQDAKQAVKDDAADVDALRLLQDLLLGAKRKTEADKLVTQVRDPLLAGYLEARALPPAKAVKALKKIKSQTGAPSSVRLDLGWALCRADQATNADSEAKAYAKAFPEDPEGYHLLGHVAMLRGKPKIALPALQKAVELEPGVAEPTVLLAEVLHVLEKPAEARAVLLAALERYDSNGALQLGLAQDHIRAGEIEDAVKLLRALIEKRGSNADALAWLSHAFRRSGELKEAATHAKKALKVEDEHVVALETLGFCSLKSGKPGEAIDAYAMVMSLDRNRVEPYVMIGFAQTLMGQLNDADEMIGKALKLDKGHIEANLKMGILQFLRGKNKGAKKYLKVVLKHDKENIAALRYSGYVALGQGRAKEALNTLEKAVQLDPDDAKTVRMVGRAHMDLGKLDKAIEMFERAVALDEKDHWAHFDLGKVNDELGEFELAKESYERAAELSAGFSWPHVYLAEIYDEIDGDDEKAIRHYQKFLDLGGPDPEERIKQRIKQLTPE